MNSNAQRHEPAMTNLLLYAKPVIVSLLLLSIFKILGELIGWLPNCYRPN